MKQGQKHAFQQMDMIGHQHVSMYLAIMFFAGRQQSLLPLISRTSAYSEPRNRSKLSRSVWVMPYSGTTVVSAPDFIMNDIHSRRPDSTRS